MNYVPELRSAPPAQLLAGRATTRAGPLQRASVAPADRAARAAAAAGAVHSAGCWRPAGRRLTPPLW